MPLNIPKPFTFIAKTRAKASEVNDNFDAIIEAVEDWINNEPLWVTEDKLVAGAGSLVPSGSVFSFGGAAAPSGYLLCDGTAVSRATFAALFAAIGTTYGAGDGSTTFNVPDLRGRAPVGKGTHADVDTLGESDGLAVGSRRPGHTHSGPSHTHTFSTGPQDSGTSYAISFSGGPNIVSASDHGHASTTAAGGTGQTGDGVPAYLILNAIIKV